MEADWLIYDHWYVRSHRKASKKTTHVYYITFQCWLYFVCYGAYYLETWCALCVFGYVKDLRTNFEEGFDGKSFKRIQELILLRYNKITQGHCNQLRACPMKKDYNTGVPIRRAMFCYLYKPISVQSFKGVCNIPTVAMVKVQWCKKTLWNSVFKKS